MDLCPLSTIPDIRQLSLIVHPADRAGAAVDAKAKPVTRYRDVYLARCSLLLAWALKGEPLARIVTVGFHYKLIGFPSGPCRKSAR